VSPARRRARGPDAGRAEDARRHGGPQDLTPSESTSLAHRTVSPNSTFRTDARIDAIVADAEQPAVKRFDLEISFDSVSAVSAPSAVVIVKLTSRK
jgi:hypothetical protein